MPKNEDGEFELVLGNRTLLLVFFVVVALLGVFFTMGYIVGRNSAPVVATDSGSGRKSEPPPVVADSASKAADSVPAAAPKETAVQQPPEPAKEPEPDKPVETAKAEPAKETAKDTAKERKAEAKAKKEAAAKLEKAKPALTGNPSGTYLQLAATSQREAEILVEILRKKEFKAIVAEIPEKPGLFRVLVGPVTDASVNKTKADLQGAGFPGDKAIKRSF